MIVRHPWSRDYEILMGGDGRIVYDEEHAVGTEMPTLLRLTREEFEALARAILEEERPEDATLDALKDARVVRDRLLSMLERREASNA